MKRLVVAALVAAVVVGCQDAKRSAVGPDDLSVSTSTTADSADLEAKINNVINDLFPQPERAEAHKIFDAIKDAVEDDDRQRARNLVSDLLALAAATDLKDPADTTTEEAYRRLIDLLFEFVGLEPPSVSADLLAATQDDDDGTVQVAVDGQDNLILSDSSFAGTFIEDEDIDQSLVIVLDRLTTDEQDSLPEGECLPTDSFPQAEGCYRFDRKPEGVFQDSVEVGVCPEDAIDGDESYQLHEFEAATADTNAVSGIVPLPSVPFPQLECGTFEVVQSPESPLPWRLAEAAWNATGSRLLRWVGPAPLRAIDSGDGGSTLDYSRIGWAKQMDVDIVQGDGQIDSVGISVSTPPKVRVTHMPEGNDAHPLQGVDVTFDIGRGNGTLNSGNTTVTETTDGNGFASVDWTLGDPGPNSVFASATGEVVRFEATANPIFLAHFDGETVGNPPSDPVFGTWLSVNDSGGTIHVEADQGSLTNKPVVFDRPSGPGAMTLRGQIAGGIGDAPDTGVYEIMWQMLSDTAETTGSVAVFEDPTSGLDQIVSVNLSSATGQDIEASVGSGSVDTGKDWTVGQDDFFRLVIDLDNKEVSLWINGDQTIQNAGFADASADNITRLEMSLGGTFRQIVAYDNFRVRRIQ